MSEQFWLSVLGFVAVVVTLLVVQWGTRLPKEKVEQGLALAHGVTDFATGIADDHNLATTTVLERLAGYAVTAVNAAEQLYKAGSMPKEARYTYAETAVKQMFKLEIPDGDWHKWYDVAGTIIEATVAQLPTTNGPKVKFEPKVLTPDQLKAEPEVPTPDGV